MRACASACVHAFNYFTRLYFQTGIYAAVVVVVVVVVVGHSELWCSTTIYSLANLFYLYFSLRIFSSIGEIST